MKKVFLILSHLFIVLSPGIVSSQAKWEEYNEGIQPSFAVSLVRCDSGLYSTSSQWGYFKWQSEIDKWIPNEFSQSVPPIQDIVFTGKCLVGHYHGSIYRSTNYGKNWIKSDSGLMFNPEINIIKFFDGALYASDWGRFLYRSNDEGVSWSRCRASDDSSGLNGYIGAMTFDDTTIYINEIYGMYYSRDKGSHWNKITDSIYFGLFGSGNKILTCDFIYLYYYNKDSLKFSKLTDSVPWKRIPFQEPNTDRIIVFKDDIYLGTDSSRMYIYRNKTKEWIQSGKEFPPRSVYRFFVDRDRIFAVTDMGLYGSDDEGKTWITQFFYDSNIISFLESRNNLYTAYNSYVSTLEVNDNKWLTNTTGLSGRPIIAFAGNDDFFAISLSNDIRIQFSTDQGASWFANCKNVNYKILCFAFLDSFALAATDFEDFSLYQQSVNDRQYNTWYPSQNLKVKGYYIQTMLASGTNIYMGTKGKGLLISTDSGNSVKEVLSPEVAKDVNVMKESLGNIYIGTSSGVFYKGAGTDNWEEINNGLNDKVIVSLAVKDNLVYAASSDGNIYCYDILNHRWDSIVLPDPKIRINTLIIYQDYIYAGTPYGVYRLRFGKTGYFENGNLSGLSEIEVYPIPADNILNIIIPDNEVSSCNVEIIAPQTGQVVGSYNYTDINYPVNLKIAINSYPTGCYFLKIASGNFIRFIKVIKI